MRRGDTMSEYHPTHDEPKPNYPAHCPACGATVHALHETLSYVAPLRPVQEWLWHWVARCDNGHWIEALPEQLALV